STEWCTLSLHYALPICCEVSVYDPVAMNEAKKVLGDTVRFAKDIYDCVFDTEVIFHVTEWKEFRLPNWEVIKRSMKSNPVLLDGDRKSTRLNSSHVKSS